MTRHPILTILTILTILMAVAGVILLLPGVCALIFIPKITSSPNSAIISLWLVCFLIAAGGVALLYKAFQHLIRRHDGDQPTLS